MVFIKINKRLQNILIKYFKKMNLFTLKNKINEA